MKTLVSGLALALACSSVFAQDTQAPTPSGQSFEQMQQEMISHIARHIARMQQAQQCARAATNVQQLQACRPQHGGAGQR